MNDLRKAAQQALEALIWHDETVRTRADSAAIIELRAALAQPEQEQEQEPKLVAAYVVQKPKWIKVIKPMKKQKVSNE